MGKFKSKVSEKYKILAIPNNNGSHTVTFSNNDGVDNNLNIGPGWSFLIRFYEPQAALLEGDWKIPELVKIN